jgi:hypothetical protein
MPWMVCCLPINCSLIEKVVPENFKKKFGNMWEVRGWQCGISFFLK